MVFSGAIDGPVTAGLLQPRVVLPRHLTDKVSKGNLNHVLVHEIAHLLRRDQWFVLIQHVVAAMYWFHPLVFGLNRMLAPVTRGNLRQLCLGHGDGLHRTVAHSLTLAELVTPQPMPGAVGLFTSRWKLEDRVAGLLDVGRNRVGATQSPPQGTDHRIGPLGWHFRGARHDPVGIGSGRIRRHPASLTTNRVAMSTWRRLADRCATDRHFAGRGGNARLLVRGRVLDVDGQPADGFSLVAKVYKSQLGRDVLKHRVENDTFEVWVPVGGSYWFHFEVAATSHDGKTRAVRGIGNRELRQAAIEGVTIQLAPVNREVTISVMHDGLPVANAHVSAELSTNLLLRSKTDANGKAVFQRSEDEKLRQLTAWTEDRRIGGFSFHRRPRRDPFGRFFTIDLDDCRDQTIRFIDAEDKSPVANVPFETRDWDGKTQLQLCSRAQFLSPLPYDHRSSR